MQPLKSKSIAILVIAILAVSVGISMFAAVDAHTPPQQITTFAYITATPNPVGVGQQTNVIMWLDTVIAGAGITNNVRFQNYQLTITSPNGTITEVDFATVKDTTSSQAYQFTPNQVGTYNLTFNFPGQTYNYGGAYQNDTYTPASASTTLTVQQEAIQYTPQTPLPSEFWSRPISGANHDWTQVASNWLAGAATSDLWQKNGAVPLSSHVMWTKPLEYGGLTGGAVTQAGQDENTAPTYYSGFSYNTRFSNPIIMQGVLYYQEPNGEAGSGGQTVAVDLQTGQTIWTSNTFFPTKASLTDYQTANQHGVVGGILWQVAGSTWIGYNAANKQWVMNLTNVPAGTEVYTNTGDILRYVFTYNATTQTGNYKVWNSTAAISSTSTLNNEPAWPMGGAGTITNGTVGNGVVIDASKAACYSADINFTGNLNGSQVPSIVGVLPGDLILGRSSNVALASQPNPNTNPWTMWAISDKADTRGNLLWVQNYTAPAGNTTQMLTMQPIDPVSRTWTMTIFETGQRLAYHLDDGKLAWGPVGPDMPPQFQYYSGREGLPAYGNFYVSGYGGVVYAYSGENGTLLWTYGNGNTAGNSTNSGIDTPWGNYPTHLAAFGGGVVYVMSGEHSPNTPLYKNYRARALNATTGQELWTLLDWSASGLGTSNAPVAIADGYMSFVNAYDGQIYTVGKGPSQTTVGIQNNVIQQGNTLLIQGTVMDKSAGTQQKEQAARFPNGVPAVADESQSGWMEYIYEQQPCPADVKGVTVTLTAVDPNGNAVNIGTATTDGNGAYTATYTPNIAGTYKIYATFAGTNSYYGSNAESAIHVTQAPTVTPTPAPVQSPADQYFIPMSAAIIVAIALVAVLLVWSILKK